MSRRWIVIPAYIVAWALFVAAAPLWLAATLALDVAGRRRFALTRGGVMIVIYLSYELIGLSVSFALWLWKHTLGLSEERWTDLHFRLEAWWGSSLLGAATLVYGLEIEVDEGDAELDRGPYLLLIRHASTADTLLSSDLICRRHGMRLRFVLKQELLWDPCLNVVGQRIPNAFVDRSSAQSAREIDRIRAIAGGLGPKDGVLIYPEGTRSTPAKLARVVQRFEEQGDQQMLDYTATLRTVLPPRLGGPLGLLESAETADVVFCAHTGLEGAASIEDLRNGELVGRAVQVQFWRFARDEIPSKREEQAQWILDRWREVSVWITEARSPRSR